MTYYCDGYCIESNPSPIGGGYTITNKNGKIIKTEKILKNGFTNNEAELLGIYNALKLSKKRNTIISDSRIAIMWVWNGNCGARPDLSVIASKARKLLEKKEIALSWLPREVNLAGHINEQFEKDPQIDFLKSLV